MGGDDPRRFIPIPKQETYKTAVFNLLMMDRCRSFLCVESGDSLIPVMSNYGGFFGIPHMVIHRPFKRQFQK
jgi:hypothetical protein